MKTQAADPLHIPIQAQRNAPLLSRKYLDLALCVSHLYLKVFSIFGKDLDKFIFRKELDSLTLGYTQLNRVTFSVVDLLVSVLYFVINQK